MRQLLATLLALLLAVPASAAITATNRGIAGNADAATTATFSPSSNFTAGTWAVLVIAADNGDTNGAAHTIFAVTDSLGNTWTRRISPLYDPGTANQGVEGAIYTTPMDGGTITTDTVVTLTTSATNTNEVATFIEVAPTGGAELAYVTGNVNAGAATNAPTVTTDSITSGHIVIAGVFNESGTAQTTTGDSDTSDGSWSTIQTVEAGSGGGGTNCSNQQKVVTGTNTQTFNPTLGTSSDVILGWIQISESGGGGAVIDPLSGGIPGNALDPLRGL